MIKTVTLSMEEYNELQDKNGVKDAKIKELEDNKDTIIYYAPESLFSMLAHPRYNHRGRDAVIMELVKANDALRESLISSERGRSILGCRLESEKEDNRKLMRRNIIQRILNK